MENPRALCKPRHQEKTSGAAVQSLHLPDAPAKRVALIENERRLGTHICGASNRGADDALRLVEPIEMTGELTAENAFLCPFAACLQFSIRRETGKLRARAGAARGTVIRFSGTEDEIPGIPATSRRTEQFNVIHLRKSLRVHRHANAPCEVREPLRA